DGTLLLRHAWPRFLSSGRDGEDCDDIRSARKALGPGRSAVDSGLLGREGLRHPRALLLGSGAGLREGPAAARTLEMTRTFAPALAAVALLAGACEKPAPSPTPAALQTEDDKTLYALGTMLGRNLTPLHLTAAEMETVRKGIEDMANGKT